MEYFVQQLINGLTLGSIYGIIGMINVGTINVGTINVRKGGVMQRSPLPVCGVRTAWRWKNLTGVFQAR